jgi:hypothetical protein
LVLQGVTFYFFILAKGFTLMYEVIYTHCDRTKCLPRQRKSFGPDGPIRVIQNDIHVAVQRDGMTVDNAEINKARGRSHKTFWGVHLLTLFVTLLELWKHIVDANEMVYLTKNPE